MSYGELLLFYARKGLFGWLRKSAFRKFCRRNKGKSFIAQTQSGFLMTTSIGDSVDNFIYVYGLYEPETTHVISTLAPECDCLIDVGCNIGYYSCLYCNTNAHGRLFAIDPNPEMIRRTEQNLKQNNFKNYRLLNCGMAAHSGKLYLNIPRFRHSLSSFAYVPKRSSGGPVDSVEIEVRPIKEIIAEHHVENALVKVDTEGFEYHVFSGLSSEAVERIVYIVFELSTVNLQQAGISPSSFFTLPWMERFSFFRIDEQGMIIKENDTHAFINNQNVNTNALLVRKDIESNKSLHWASLLRRR
jgi:FkbM family methyltransferase